MARWADGTGPLDGADALSADVGYADPLRAETRADSLAGTAPADSLAGTPGGDTLALPAGRDTLAAPAPVPWAATGADPLISYPDATLLLGGPGVAAPPVPEPTPAPRPTPPAAPRTARPVRPRGRPGWPDPAGVARPGWSAPPAARRQPGRAVGAGPPPVPGPRRDAISWSELTIRGRAAADRRAAADWRATAARRPAAPPSRGGGSGWDSFFSRADQPGGRRPWVGRPNPSHNPQSLRDLLDLIRHAMRG